MRLRGHRPAWNEAGDSNDTPTGDSKLDGVNSRTRGCTCWVSRSVARALGGGRIQRMAGSFCRRHKLPAKISWCTQQWPGLETEAAMSGEPGWQLGETWMPWALAAKPSSCPSCLVLPSLSTMYPYSWLGKGELDPRGKWVPWNSLRDGGYVWAGGRNENMEGNGLLAVQMQ